MSEQKYAQILQLGQIIASDMDMNFLLDELILRTNDILGTERSSLFLHDPKTDQLYSLAGTGLDHEVISVASDKGVVGWVFQHQKTTVVFDAYQDSRFSQQVDHQLNYQTKNIICSPLINRNHECIGVVEALNKHKGKFDDNDIFFLNHISTYASLLIEYINLHQEKEIINIARERIINHLSHELKTPLSIIASVFEFISRELDSKCRERLQNTISRGQRNIHKLMEMQEKIEDIVNKKESKEKVHILQFIQSTIDFIEDCKEESSQEQREIFKRIVDRIESLFPSPSIQIENLKLDTFLEALCRTTKQESSFRDIEIKKTFQENLWVTVDRKILGKTISGLLKNAIENTPDNGRIIVSSKTTPEGIQIDIQDFGVGISEHNQKFIFAGFFHTQDTYLYSSKRNYIFNAGGAGIDLLRIKALSEQNGFSVTFRSSRCRFIPDDKDICPGKISDCFFVHKPSECFASGGSTFSLTFPITQNK